ncbi:MAG: L-lactate permease [Pirellulaceae bacterium]|nr:L-lactate permease [Pirellulaceae bacterium]
MTWQQNYDPLSWWPLSTLAAAVPVVTLFFVLLVLRRSIWMASLAGFLMAIAMASFVFGMPSQLIAGASLSGVVFGFTRIAWLIIASLFLFHVAVESGQFQVMKESISGLSADRRLQVILIAFCFGAFLEGTGGGGAPVAIAGSFLIGLGVPPFEAAVLCLLANTAPVAWGGVGNPIRTLEGVTNIDIDLLNAMVGRILPPFSFILPTWLIVTMAGWRRALEVLPALLVSGGSFAAMQFYWSNYQEAGLVDIVSAIFSLLVTVVFLKFWKPRNLMTSEANASADTAQTTHSLSSVLKAWSPFIVTSLLIFLWSYSAFNQYLTNKALNMPAPWLSGSVLRMPPVVAEPVPEVARLDLNVLILPGTAVFFGAVLSAFLSGMSFGRVAGIFGRTCRQLLPSMLAISCMVGLAYITKYSGMDTVMGLSLTRTGWAYPFFGTLLGWLGVALTGTDAGSNALFGNLQKVTAEQVGVSPVLMASANSAGGVMGKMIDAQSILVASTACKLSGREADVFKAVIYHSIALACLVGLLVTTYAYVCPWIIPGGP